MDVKRNAYVRQGVTEQMPLGTHWTYIPGEQKNSHFKY